VCDCQETKQLWDRIAKLEADKTVLVEALKKIESWRSSLISTSDILQGIRGAIKEALKAVKEGDK
jgi:ribosomal 50S subunit-associated protein YjgA (DUF615 family)